MLRKLKHVLIAHLLGSYAALAAAEIAYDLLRGLHGGQAIRFLTPLLWAPILPPIFFYKWLSECLHGQWDWVLLIANITYFIVVILIWSQLHHRLPLAQRRRLAGQCPACGYDLRATPNRCPECGAGPQNQ